LRLPVKALALALPIIGLLWLAYTVKPEWFDRVSGQASQEITGVQVPTANIKVTAERPTEKLVYQPSAVRAESAGTWRHLGIAWNGQIGLIFANGGKATAPDSLMAKSGVNLSIERQDNYSIMQAELLKFANAYHGGEKDPTVGVHSVTIMGDAGASFLAGLQPQLDKLDLHAKIIGATGRSYGEDKCMGPAEWMDNPQAAKGGVIAGVLRDGDIHICLIWAQANGLKVNPDEHTWDEDALNFFATDSFQDADKALLGHTCESRPVVKNGIGTGSTKNVCVQGTATWTPGDVNVVQNGGNVVSLLSTRENGAQMFSTIIVIDEWARENPATVTNFLKAALDGSATVASDRTALRKAAEWSALVWGEQDANYWERYFYGRMEDSGTTGRQVRLGGSQALGLASNLEYFLPAGSSVYDRVYMTFGDLDHKLYPDVMPEYPKNVVDTSFLEKIRDAVGSAVGKGAVFGQFTGAENQQVASRSYSINFAVGSATILPSSTPDLEQILSNVTVGSSLAIRVEGHTSSEGEPAANMRLSEARANAVRDWLIQHTPQQGLISRERITVMSFGESNLVLKNGVEDRAASRRVEIKLLGSD
jgi:OmpA-OmpF porin, OOP family